MQARGQISPSGGHRAHLSALAYMSDSYFVGTVARVHDIPRFSSSAALKKVLSSLKNPSDLESDSIAKYFKDLGEQEKAELAKRIEHKAKSQPSSNDSASRKEIGMMVSLDHTIYFHDRRGFRADDWMYVEMASPWAGEGRGLVTQKIWSLDGTLIATCFQEVR